MSDDLTPRFPGGKRRYDQFMAFTGRYSRPFLIAWTSAIALSYLFAFLIQDFTRSMQVVDGPRASGPPPVNIMEPGRAAFRADDHLRARALLLPLAESGFPEAQLLIGETFVDSRAGRPDRCEAAKWFDRAARQGNVSAQWNLAKAYRYGDGIPKDLEKAYLWARWAKHIDENSIHRYGLTSIAQKLSEQDRRRLDAALETWAPEKESPARIIRIPNIPFLGSATRHVIGVDACRPWTW